jgi:benzoylformate decarboxylase
MAKIKVRDAFLRQLKREGLGVIFGNPGSTEENLLKAIGEDREIRYILGLQEASVAAMADGWARVTGKPAVCQIHSAVGLGNAMGILYEAFRSHTPMVMLAGEPPLELQAFDGFLAGDLAQLAQPLTKWSQRITHGRQALRILRRAVKVASTPPLGPVFLALPMDTLDEEIDEAEILPASPVVPPAACDPADAGIIARKLAEAERPMIFAGDGVTEAGAGEALTILSKMLAAPIWGVECNEFNFSNPLFMGLIGHSFGANTRTITTQADAALIIGTPAFPELFPAMEPYFQNNAAIMQIDRDPWEIAKNFPVDIGLQADPKGSLRAIINALSELHISKDRILARYEKIIGEKKRRYEEIRAKLDGVPDTADRMSPGTMMRTLVRELPGDCLIYDEALTSSGALQHYLEHEKPDTAYILGRGGCIGVGWPGAVGAAVALPDKRIIAPSGDGSALFALQTLWTAARYRLKIVFLACNNGAYRILKINMLHYFKDNKEQLGTFPYMDLDSPAIDFSRLAEGFGMRTFRAKNTAELQNALRESFGIDGPALIDVMLNGSVEQEIQDMFKQ